MADKQDEPDAALDEVSERLRELNESIIAAGRKSGRAYLDAYEVNLKALAEYQTKLAESTDEESVAALLKAQADFTRKIAGAVAAHGEDLLK
jgi:hypothetical protein